VDEFTGATSKGQESSAPTIAKITKVCFKVFLILIVDWKGKGEIGV
jgi:hypothetical protein